MANHRKSAGFVLTWTSPRKSPGRPFVVLSSPPSQIAEAVVVPSSVLAHPPRWLSAAQLHPAPAPLLRDWLFEFEPLQAGDDAQHWLLQLREADPRPEGGR